MDHIIDFSINNAYIQSGINSLIQSGIIVRKDYTNQLEVAQDTTVAKVNNFEKIYGNIPADIKCVIMTEIATRYENEHRNTALENYCYAKTSVIKVRKVNELIYVMYKWRILEPIDKNGNLYTGPITEARLFRFVPFMVGSHEFYGINQVANKYVEEKHLTQKQFDELQLHIYALDRINKEYMTPN